MSKLETYAIGSSELTYDLIERILRDGTKLTLSPEAVEKIQHCRDYLDRKTDENTVPIYGVTTGFGSLCNKHISSDDLSTLQENLVKSHSCSVGTPIDADVVRLMLLLKAHALSMGFSGVQVETVQRILDFYNNDILPVVYDRGSLGASGDLAPLANLFLPLIGEGYVMYKGKEISGKEALNIFGWNPIKLKSKEGLALLNGTQFMSANGIKALIDGWHLVNCFDLFGAMSLEAFDGRIEPFFPQIQQVRPHKGQIETARVFRSLLKGSEIIKREKEHVQDPYSFRCIPQVHGAVKDAMWHVTDVLHTEINSVTDNPTVFPDEDLVISGGNFHGEPIALIFDYMGVALHELGNISERRVAQLILGLRGLPEFLVAKPGLNSGFMIPQYAAASMVSQNKMYAWPASCDSIVSSNGQEDLVSMGANAATKLHKIISNLQYIAAIELMNAAQALEFRRPLKSSPYIEHVMEEYRRHVPFVEDDVVMADYIAKTMDFLNGFDVTIESANEI
ncbi:MAG: histidine ammonia-lyase [Muribaculaceae bacterium]|nr:histidine ammonia-lyase [Muribaculaceae bacterium]